MLINLSLKWGSLFSVCAGWYFNGSVTASPTSFRICHKWPRWWFAQQLTRLGFRLRAFVSCSLFWQLCFMMWLAVSRLSDRLRHPSCSASPKLSSRWADCCYFDSPWPITSRSDLIHVGYCVKRIDRLLVTWSTRPNDPLDWLRPA